MLRSLSLAALGAALLAGCSEPPRDYGVLLNTVPPGAACTLTLQGQPIATVAPTPGIAAVEPVPGALAVYCRRPAFADAAMAIPVAEAPRDFWSYGSRRPLVAYPERVDIPMVPLPR